MSFAQVLIGIALPLHAHDPIGVDLDQSRYALGSTTIDLSLPVAPWARLRKHKAALKRHTLLDLHGNIPALTIAETYRCRWQVELFFKWNQQQLRIKAFFGASGNAVDTQIWIAVSAHVLVAIVRKTLGESIADRASRHSLLSNLAG